MIKNKIKEYIKNRSEVLKESKFKIFGTRMYNPSIWYLNKYTVSRAMSIGLFFAWIPVPFQMFLAAGFSIILKANLPLSVSLVWITNPITMPFFFLFAYKIGSFFIPISIVDNFYFEISFTFFFYKMNEIWKPFILGCFICGFFSALFGNILIRLVWRFSILKSWKNRKKR